ncbi:hypothetical protein L2E82_51545 [Cichorium intybus]|nr:hypothetical protein L2E82_51545 [Cichorium intybus]
MVKHLKFFPWSSFSERVVKQLTFLSFQYGLRLHLNLDLPLQLGLATHLEYVTRSGLADERSRFYDHLSYAIRGEASQLACTLILGRVIKALGTTAKRTKIPTGSNERP